MLSNQTLTMPFHRTPLTLLAISATFSLSLGSCSLKNTTTGIEHTPFLASTGVASTSHLARLPFQHSWRDPNVRIDQYKNIIVRPITLRYLKVGQWAKSEGPWIPTEKSFLRNSNNLAKFWDKSLKHSFSSPVCSYYLTQNASQPQTLILEVALTEITFGRPAPTVGAASVPAGSLLNTVNTPPLVAFEARVKDATTGKIIATVSDRRTDRLEIRNFTKTNLAEANREICKQWSEQLMQSTNRELFAKVKGSWFSPF